MSEEKALDKIDIANELKTLSPIEVRSIELKKMADEVEIGDKPSYKEAKKIRRELITHRTSTKDLRLTFTRKLDNLKDQFIKKQDEVLELSLVGEDTIKKKIADYEEVERQRKEAEEQRMQKIIDTFRKSLDNFDRTTATVADINRIRAYIKAEVTLLAQNDRNKVAVKTVLAELRSRLDDEKNFVVDRIAQEEERARFEAEKKAEAERAKQEAVNAQANMKVEKETLENRNDTQKSIKNSQDRIDNVNKQAVEEGLEKLEKSHETISNKDQKIKTSIKEAIIHMRIAADDMSQSDTSILLSMSWTIKDFANQLEEAVKIL